MAELSSYAKLVRMQSSSTTKYGVFVWIRDILASETVISNPLKQMVKQVSRCPQQVQLKIVDYDWVLEAAAYPYVTCCGRYDDVAHRLE